MNYLCPSHGKQRETYGEQERGKDTFGVPWEEAAEIRRRNSPIKEHDRLTAEHIDLASDLLLDRRCWYCLRKRDETNA
jgi:hypothetical protein